MRMTLADRVAEAADFAMRSARKGFTIRELADALDCSYTVANYTRGELANRLAGGAIQMDRDRTYRSGSPDRHTRAQWRYARSSASCSTSSAAA
jgi:hypothetical protein